MSFLDIDTSEAVEPTAVPGDKEYKIRIVGYIEKEIDEEMEKIWNTKNGDPCFMPIFEIADEPTAKEFNHFMPIPHKNMTEKENNSCLWRLEQFKRAFSIPEGRVDLEDTIGNEGWAILGLKEDEEYGEQNFIKKMIVPKR